MDEIIPHLEQLGIAPFGSESFAPSSQDQVQALERRLGVTLPAEYRLLLLHFGAFRFTSEVIFFGEDGGRYEFGFFFGTDEVQECWDSPPDQFPPDCLAIGEEGLGNFYCLGLKGRFTGKVWYWIHDVGWGEAEEFVIQGLPIPQHTATPCLHMIADSMDSFLRSLLLA